MTAPYHLYYYKSLMIFNPKDRDPLPIAMFNVEYEYLVDALTDYGCSLHQFEPLEVLDKVGFIKRGDDAAEVVLDALQHHLRNKIAAGLSKGLGSPVNGGGIILDGQDAGKVRDPNVP